MDTQKKVWFITGCSKGFGKALVDELLNNTNHSVVVTARNPQTLQHLNTLFPDRVLTLKLDVQNQNDINQAVSLALEKFHTIDVLVNNAGYGLAGALEECSMQDIRNQFETNVFGLIALTKAVLPIMRNQASGHIINISSVGGLVAIPGAGLYNSTKFAVEGLSECLASEVANFGIKVSIIEPGPFRTDFAGSSIVLSPQIDAYKNSNAAEIREYLPTMHQKQPGDPVKAAQIIIQLTQMDNPPLRLLLGNIALQRFFDANQKQIAEFRQYESLSRSADYDSQSS